MNIHRRHITVLLLVISLILTGIPSNPVIAAGGPAIQNVQILTANLAVYDRFEAQFDITTVSTNPYLPYDPALPAGLQPGAGIRVDALFSRDNWASTITQPAFWYQPYTYSEINGEGHWIPSGSPRWAVRFTPQSSGSWQMKLQAADAGGTTTSGSAWNFSVSGASSNSYRRHGFLRVSPADPRYFDFQDGSPFIGVGFNSSFQEPADVEARLRVYEQNKINMLRVWMSGAGINASQWTAWATHHLPSDAYLPGVSYNWQSTYNGGDVAWKLDSTNPCLFAGYAQGRISVQPGTTYTIKARVKVTNVTGPAGSGGYGFAIKQAGWLGTNCERSNPGQETLLTTPLSGTSDWTEVSGTLTTQSNQNFLDLLYLTRHNATGGTVDIDEVRLYRQNDPAQVNLLSEGQANSHLVFDPLQSYQWDQFLGSAEQHGVYLKIVLDEKNEWIRNRLGSDGHVSANASNDNFYSASGTKVRWLEQAWWRYVIARWGYSTAVHSLEYINEGDPYNGKHHEAAGAMGRYFDDTDPSHHLTTTSFWAAFPNQEFWSDVDASAVDYTDLHQYIAEGDTLSFLGVFQAETDPANIRTGNGSALISGTNNNNQAITPRGLVLHEPGEWIIRYWMKASNFTANCQFGSSGGMQRLRWQLDGGKYSGGKEGVVPNNNEGKDFICTSPGGTYNWTQFSSDRDRNGSLLAETYRLVVNDSQPHELSLRLENTSGTGGKAWIDDVELVSPSGKVTPVIGQFDTTSLFTDISWYTAGIGSLWGGASPVGAHKPLVIGETGLLDAPGGGSWNPNLNRDEEGIWLHNLLWAQAAPGGGPILPWWATETIEANPSTGRNAALYPVYLRFRNFMEGIPINNGRYQDARAQTSHPDLRAWGQRDDNAARAFLWIQNRKHTWQAVISGTSIPAVNGTVSLPNMPPGTYRVEWWNPHASSNPILSTGSVVNTGTLTLNLPGALYSDVAVKLERTASTIPNMDNHIYIPIVVR